MLPRARPRVPLQVRAPAAVPSQARPPRRPTRGPPLPPDGREGPASPKEVSGEETGTHLPGGGAAPGRAGKSELGGTELYPRHPQAPAVQGHNPGRSHQGAARENWALGSPVTRVPLNAPVCLFLLRGSSSGLHPRLIRTLEFAPGLLMFLRFVIASLFLYLTLPWCLPEDKGYLLFKSFCPCLYASPFLSLPP